MYICICNQISDKDVVNIIDKDIKEIKEELQIGNQCGICLEYFYQFIKERRKDGT